MNPRLSIIIPSYNYGKYLVEALESILSQDYDDYEVILIDDCSTDNSSEISKIYSQKHSAIHYIQHDKNRGLFECFLTGLKEVRGDYIHCFSADDKYLSGFLSKSMLFLEQHPEAGIVCTDLAYFQSDTFETKKLLEDCEEPLFFPKESTAQLFRTTNFWVTGASCITKREHIEKYGPFISQLENLSDWFLFHKIALCEGIGYIPETLTSMRVHDQSLTNQVKRNKKRRRATYRHLLNSLLQDKGMRRRFLDAHLLDFIFRDLKWKLYFNPKYLCYWKR